MRDAHVLPHFFLFLDVTIGEVQRQESGVGLSL